MPIFNFSRLSLAAIVCLPLQATMVINPTYDDASMTQAGYSAGQITSVHNAFALAASMFTARFTDNININITVQASSAPGLLGQSSTSLYSFGFNTIRDALFNDKTTADDITATGLGGSASSTLTDPAGGTHNWWVSKAQAKALGLIANDSTNDGTFTFGVSYAYDYNPADGITVNQIDFVGVAMHEISEIMGRIQGLGANIGPGPGYLLHDLFRYTGAGARGVASNGAGVSFSLDNGNTLLYGYNNAGLNGGDASDWASGGNDSFNAFSTSGVVNSLTGVDYRLMDAIGYDYVPAAVPEPSTFGAVGLALTLGAMLRTNARSVTVRDSSMRDPLNPIRG